ncbi:MAG: DUF1080 domain-containing protein [Verrucomicrobiae bacterium]|nr:DUF1080 domain-containing protein [Verrucomicrobiae bacterium]
MTTTMRRAARWAMAVLGALAMGPAASGAEWQSLFNGRDLAGWVPVHDVRFEVHDGRLRLVRGMGWLRTEKEYGDFVLEVELRPLVERYDSGLFFRVGLEGKPWPTDGWQINLRRDLWGALIQGYRTVLRSPVEGPDVDEEEPWSKFRIEVRGRKATLEVDGKRVWEFDGIDRERGYLGIQAEDRVFDFRSLRVRELDGAGGEG